MWPQTVPSRITQKTAHPPTIKGTGRTSTSTMKKPVNRPIVIVYESGQTKTFQTGDFATAQELVEAIDEYDDSRWVCEPNKPHMYPDQQVRYEFNRA